jgi:predicted aspartyl protease
LAGGASVTSTEKEKIMWFIPLIDVVGDLTIGALVALFALAVFHGPEMKPMPPGQHPSTTQTVEKFDTFADNGGAEIRVSAKINDNNRCLVRAAVNGRGPFVFIVDSGAPDLWFSIKDVPQLGIDPSTLRFAPFGDREGNVAWVTLKDVRVGEFMAHNVTAAISDKANFRLLGMSVLKQGRMEVQGDTCSLTFPRNARPPHAPTN